METVQDILKTKLFDTHYISDLKDMVYQSAKKYKDRMAFKLKDKNGKIYQVSYNKLKEDVISLGTALLNMGMANNKIAVIREKQL